MPRSEAPINPIPETGFGWVDALVNAMQRDPMGGMSPMPMAGGVVRSALHPEFQYLKSLVPKMAEAMERSPRVFNYIQPGQVDNYIAQFLDRSASPAAAQSVRGLTTFDTLAPTVNGLTPISIAVRPDIKGAGRGITNIHEALHGLYYDKQGPAWIGGDFPTRHFGNIPWRDLPNMGGIMNYPQMIMEKDLFGRMLMRGATPYAKVDEWGHGALHALSKRLYDKAAGNIVPYPPIQ